MKAPEKIYLTEDNPSKEWFRTKQVGFDSIEYIRTDALIEKTLKFIKTNVDRIVNNQHGVCMGCMDKEFKEYINGE